MARGMAIWTMIFTGCQAVGALIWGVVADQVGLFPTFVVAAVLAVVAVGLGLSGGCRTRAPTVWIRSPTGVRPGSRCRPTRRSGRSRWRSRTPSRPSRKRRWLAAMCQLRRSRLRTGATRWELYRDAEHRDRFVEQFWVATWEEHLRQHEGRLTTADQSVERTALGYSDPAATSVHLLPP